MHYGTIVSISASMTSFGFCTDLCDKVGIRHRQVRKIIGALGFESVDVGPLRFSRELEGMAILYVTPYLRNRRDESWEYHFRVR